MEISDLVTCPQCGRQQIPDAKNGYICIGCGCQLTPPKSETPVTEEVKNYTPEETAAMEIYSSGRKLNAVKYLKDHSNLDLRSAKDRIDSIAREQGYNVPATPTGQGCVVFIVIVSTAFASAGYLLAHFA